MIWDWLSGFCAGVHRHRRVRRERRRGTEELRQAGGTARGRRKSSLLLCPLQGFLDGLCAPLRGEVAGGDVAPGVKDRYLIVPLPLSTLERLAISPQNGRTGEASAPRRTPRP